MLFNLLENTPKEGNGVVSFVIMGVLIIAIIALFVWQSITNKKRQKEAVNMVESLKVGDRVKTIGGICGFVAEINNAENTFVLETGTDDKKSYVKFDKGAIYQTAPAQGNAVPAPAVEQPVEETTVEQPAEQE
jgi:preprotein translocase subunit YajC